VSGDLPGVGLPYEYLDFAPPLPAGVREVMERMFGLLGRLPLLTVAEDADRCAAMDARRDGPRGPCALCGTRRARYAIVVGPSDLVGWACWLDACHGCWSALLAWGGCGLRDDEILGFYEEWRARTGGLPAG
jgi:hypothetical protein